MGAVRLAVAAAAMLLAGCSSHYKTAVRDIALSPDRRLAQRVTSMEESALRALRAIGDAAHGVRTEPGSARAAAHRARLANDAEAAAFEYSRHVLIVTDVLEDASTPSVPGVSPLRASMLAAEASLTAAVGAIRDCTSEDAGARNDQGHSELSSGAGALDRYLAQAKADIGAVARNARAITDAINRAPVQPASRVASP